MSPHSSLPAQSPWLALLSANGLSATSLRLLRTQGRAHSHRSPLATVLPPTRGESRPGAYISRLF